MGESNREAIALIAEVTGHEPRYGRTPDDEQCLHIGDVVLIATGFALWGDPSAWLHGDGSLTVRWGGQVARFSSDSQGSWTAEVHRNPLQGKARFVT